jgi:hypothetical protein
MNNSSWRRAFQADARVFRFLIKSQRGSSLAHCTVAADNRRSVFSVPLQRGFVILATVEHPKD